VEQDNLGGTFSEQGRHMEAEQLEVECWRPGRGSSRDEDPVTLLTMANLAWTWIHLGRDQDAKELMRKTVDLHSKILGPQHSRTVHLTRILERMVKYLLVTSV